MGLIYIILLLSNNHLNYTSPQILAFQEALISGSLISAEELLGVDNNYLTVCTNNRNIS